MKRILFGLCSALLLVTFCAGADEPSEKDKQAVADRLQAARDVLQEVMATPDKSIPTDLLNKAHCAVIVPGVKKGAFIFGGRYGKGFISCRKKGGRWSAPAAIRVEGGSFGFQIGGEEIDVVMLVMNDRGAQHLMSSQFTLGGEGSIAAGPVGRTSTADTDAYMHAEILSWSRTRGVFGGIALAGATLRTDQDDNAALYGKKLDSKEVIDTRRPVPVPARPLIELLTKYSPHETD
jgi:lipid-binding SYLF domain-containing protein